MSMLLRECRKKGVVGGEGEGGDGRREEGQLGRMRFPDVFAGFDI